MAVDAQGVGDPVLHLAGVLGARVHQPLTLLLRDSVGDLAFKVKMLLPSDLERAAQAVGSALDCRIRVAPSHSDRRQHTTLLGQSLTNAQDGGQRLHVELDLPGRFARLHDAAGHDQGHHLPDMLDPFTRQNRLVMRVGGQQRIAGDVICEHHSHHAGHGQGRAAVDATQQTMGER